ncbi:MAG: methyl-accepting chemotaxis protein [Firmicutes bacterium]|nr:methyl-accepting chemotaxis protein [Bacillota bacterium]
MSPIRDWKLKKKLLTLTGFMILAMAGLGFYNIQITSRVARGGADIFNKNLLGVQYSLTAKSAFLNISTEIYKHIGASSSQEFDEYEKAIDSQRQELDAALKNFESVMSGQKALELLMKVRTNATGYTARIPKLQGLSRAGRDKEAREFVNSEMLAFQEKAMANLDELVKLEIADAEEQDHENDALDVAARINALIAVLVVAVLSILLEMWIAGLIVKPVRQIQAVAEALADGDLTKTVSYKAGDEVGVMASSINRAMENLRGIVGRVVQASEQVAASSEELAASAEEVGKATEQIAGSIGQMAKGADEQAKSAQQAGETVEQVSSIIQQVTAFTQKMAGDSQNTAEAARTGRESVDRAVAQIGHAQESVNQSAVVVKTLGERSREIGKIMEVITGIAEQTNLLALNAAIEAARAGEQGRGFAVVAQEVGKLAAQSHQASEQIENLIKQIQRDTVAAVASMETGTRDVSTGVQAVMGAGQAFSEILRAVEGLVAQIHEVSAASRKMAEGADTAVKAVENIAAITEESAASAEEISASSEEQNATVEEIGGSSASLARMAQDLQAVVGVFRY